MNKNSFEKKCPDCSGIIIYKSLASLKYSLEKNVSCRSCKNKKQPLFRTCPQCSSNITYANKGSKYMAEKKKSLCKSCGIKNGLNNDATKKKKSENMKGENNPMYGTGGYYGVWVEKYGVEEADRRQEKCIEKRNETRKLKEIQIQRN